MLHPHASTKKKVEDKGLRYQTKPTLGNCFLAFLYLCIRGNVGEIVGVSTESIWWPYHFVILNHQGHALHFMHYYPDDENKYAPWWFTGTFQGIKSGELEKRLEESGREICFHTRIVFPVMCLFFLLWLVLAIPYMIAWGLFPLWWCLMWARNALKIRQRKKLTNGSTGLKYN